MTAVCVPEGGRLSKWTPSMQGVANHVKIFCATGTVRGQTVDPNMAGRLHPALAQNRARTKLSAALTPRNHTHE